MNRFAAQWWCAILLMLMSGAVVCPAFAVDKKDAKATDKGGEGAEEETIGSEFLCEADVYYSWKRVPADKVASNLQGAPAPDPDQEVYAPIEVFFTKVRDKAVIKEEAERNLKSKLTSAEAEARRYCESVRQNKGECIASHLLALGTDLNNMDFESRRAVRQQVTEDCTNNTGVCITTRSSQPECFESKTGTAAGEKEDAAAAPAEKKPPEKKK